MMISLIMIKTAIIIRGVPKRQNIISILLNPIITSIEPNVRIHIAIMNSTKLLLILLFADFDLVVCLKVQNLFPIKLIMNAQPMAKISANK